MTKTVVCPNCKYKFEIEIWVDMPYTETNCPNCHGKLAISNNWGKYGDLDAEKRFRYDNGVWDNNVEDMADALLTEKECCDLLNKYDVGYNQCRKDVLRLEEDLDYYKTKCASLETGLIQSDREIKQLKQGLTEMIGIIDRKIKNNDCNPSQDFRVYSAVNKALKNLKADLRSCMEEHYG